MEDNRKEKAFLTSIIDQGTSRKTGDKLYLVTWKDEDGKSAQTWVDMGYRNYSHWAHIIENRLDKRWYKNLVFRGRVVDADSAPIEVQEAPADKIS